MIKMVLTALTFGALLGGLVVVLLLIHERGNIKTKAENTTVLPIATMALDALSPSPTEQKTTFLVTLSLHGRGKGGDSPSQTLQTSTRMVNLQVLTENNEVMANSLGNLVFDPKTGSFKGSIEVATAMPPSNYSIKLKTNGYLRRLIPGKVKIPSHQPISLPAVTLIAGDIDGDNFLTILDYNILLGCYNDFYPAKSCTTSQKFAADLNDDGVVNQIDYNLFLRELPIQAGE